MVELILKPPVNAGLIENVIVPLPEVSEGVLATIKFDVQYVEIGEGYDRPVTDVPMVILTVAVLELQPLLAVTI